jgi:hypothetical protein
MPIQIDSMMDLLAVHLGHLCGGGALRAGDHRRRANFSATGVRFFLSAFLPPALHPDRCLAPAIPAEPVPPLRCPANSPPLPLATSRAVRLAAIAPAAQQEGPPTRVHDALNQAKIVHRRAPPPEIRFPPGTRATNDPSNASTAATEGSE